MIVQRVAGCTRVLGKCQGYIGLPVRDIETNGRNVMETAWEPTPAELALLNAGGTVRLYVLGEEHPPVKIEVLPANE